MRKLSIRISMREPGSDPIFIELDCRVKNQQGEDDRIASMLLEAEMHGNDGKARVHSFVVE